MARQLVLNGCLMLAVYGCAGRNVQPWKTRLQRPQLSQEQFTEIVAEGVGETLPTSHVRVIGPLAISVKSQSGESTCHLENAWRECRDNPGDRTAVVNRHLEAISATHARLTDNSGPDLDDVVPIVKGKRWLDESRQQGMDVYHERLAADLFVVYAEDGTHQLRFVKNEELAAFKMSRDAMRAKALANLDERLLKIERYGHGPLYMLAAGGTFEASLLLFSDIWEELRSAVDGRIVVAVPSRDLLMFTGENAHESIQQMQSVVDDVFTNGNYLISKELLIRNKGHWIRRDEEGRVPDAPKEIEPTDKK